MQRISAVLSVLAALAASAAQAVWVNADGHGQALIYPYYTVRSADGNAYNTYVSIVNHTNDAKVLRVRFRESLNGREVANFNLYLGPRDAWASAVIPTIDTSTALMITSDNSCTNPGFISHGAGGWESLGFSPASYSGANSDGLGESGLRTYEGYVEVIEMATLAGASATQATPGSNGSPTDCAVLWGSPSLQLGPPTGGLSGTLTLINVASGLDFTVNATALAGLTAQAFYRTYTDPYPDWNAAEVTAVGYFVTNGKAYRTTVNSGLDAVSAVLMRVTLDNEFILDSATLSATDFVVTLPTKRLHVTTATGGGTGPFASAVVPGTRSVGFDLELRSREGQSFNYTDNCGSPPAPRCVEYHVPLPSAVSVLGISGSATGALGARDRLIFATTFPNGSLSLRFLRGSMSVAATSTRVIDGATASENAVLVGLPAVGFAVRTLRNGTLTCASGACQGNYGGAYPHKSRLQVLSP